ncbi:MAG: hypothetical protein WC897_03460 [Candidatus Gracilibacteria bacterium]
MADPGQNPPEKEPTELFVGPVETVEGSPEAKAKVNEFLAQKEEGNKVAKAVQTKRQLLSTEVAVSSQLENQEVDLLKQVNPLRALSDTDPETKAIIESSIQNLILKALTAGIKPEDLAKSPLSIQPYIEKDNERETLSVKILGDLITHNDKETLEEWHKWLDKTNKIYVKSLDNKTRAEKTKTSPEKPDWMSPSIQGTLIAAGALGAGYFLWKYFTKEEKDKKISDAVAGVALGAVALGTFFGGETIGKWSADYLNLSLSSETISNFGELRKEKGIWEAIKSLTFSSTNPGIKKTAELLKIKERTIIDVRDVKWDDFSSIKSTGGRMAKKTLQASAKATGLANLPGNSIASDAKTAEEEDKIEQFIKRHLNQIDGSPRDMTIGEILDRLEEKGVFGTPEDGKENADGKKETKDETDETQGDEPKVLEGEEAQSALAKNFPGVQASVEGVINGEVGIGDALADISTSVWDRAGAFLFSGDSVFIVKGATAIPFISNMSIIKDQLADLCAAIDGSGPIRNVPFEMEQAYWVGGFAAVSAGIAVWKGQGGVLRAATGGAARGFVLSYTFTPEVLIKSCKYGTEGSQYLRGLAYDAKILMANASPEEKLLALHQRTAYWGEQYAKYYDKCQNEASPKFFTSTKAWLYKKMFGEKWNEKMSTRAGKHFLESKIDLLKATGIDKPRSHPSVANISTEAIESIEVTVRQDLRNLAESFATDHPVSSLPKIPNLVVSAPKYATHIEADTARWSRLDIDETMRGDMERFGLNNERVSLRLRELGFTKPELKELLKSLKDAEDKGKPIKYLEEKIFQIKNPRLWKAATKLKGTIGVLGAIYMFADISTSEDKFNTAGAHASGMAGFTVGMKAGGMLPLPGVPARAIAGIAGGLAGATGGVTAWNAWGEPYLEENFPNRNQFFKTWEGRAVTDMLAVLGGAHIGGTLTYIGESTLGIGQGVDAKTDPLEYLKETTYTAHPDFVKEMFAGDRLNFFGNHLSNTIEDLKKNAKEALEDANEDLTKLQKELKENQDKLALTTDTSDSNKREDLFIRIEELEQKIEETNKNIITYQTYVDGTWIEIKKIELICRQSEALEPAFQKFKRLVSAKFGEKAEEPMTRLISRIQEGREGVKGEKEMEIWKFLFDQKIDMDGREVSFNNFILLAVATYQDAKMLKTIEKQNPVVEGESEELA